MTGFRKCKLALVLIISVGLWYSAALAAGPNLDAWKPGFDPSGAKYKCIISNVSIRLLKGSTPDLLCGMRSGNERMDRFMLTLNRFQCLAGKSRCSINSRWAPSREWGSVPWHPPIWGPGSGWLICRSLSIPMRSSINSSETKNCLTIF